MHRFCLGLWIGVALAGTSFDILSPPTAFAADSYGNYLVLLDTSGSMQACYAKQSDTPAPVSEFLQAFSREILAPGDNLILIPFDNKIHDDPVNAVVLRNAQPQQVQHELARLRLEVREGRGTVRTTAIGRGLIRLEKFLEQYPAYRERKSVVLVVTDEDDDAEPTPDMMEDKRFYDEAVASKALTSIWRWESGPLVVQVYAYRPKGLGSSKAPLPHLADRPISDLKRLIARTFGRSPTYTAALNDLYAHTLSLSLESPRVAGRLAELSVPVTVTSNFERLWVQGPLRLHVQIERQQGQNRVVVPISHVSGSPVELSLSPTHEGASSTTAQLTVSLSQPLPFWALRSFTGELTVTADTSELKLTLDKLLGSDEEATERVLDVPVFRFPAERPPIVARVPVKYKPSPWGVVGLAIGLLLLASLAKILWPKAAEQITVYYYYGDPPVPGTVGLPRPGDETSLTVSQGITACKILLRRRGREGVVEIVPTDCTVRGQPTGTVTFGTDPVDVVLVPSDASQCTGVRFRAATTHFKVLSGDEAELEDIEERAFGPSPDDDRSESDFWSGDGPGSQ